MTATNTLNLHQIAIAVAACVRAGHVPFVLGSPGIAKTTLMRALAPLLGRVLGLSTYPVEDCILSNRESVDIGGFPVTLSGDVELRLFGTLKRAAERPSLLFLDELLTCSQSVQGPAMRLVRERVAGEIPLHELTRIVCASNPAEQAPGGIQLTAPLVNRLIILSCRPDVEEVAMYFAGEPGADLTTDIELPDDVAWQERRTALRHALSGILRSQPDLVVLDAPPDASIHSGAPFASPRAWEMCCDVLAALPSSISHGNPITRAIAVGALGDVGLTFLKLIRARAYGPTVEQLLTAPDTCPLPDPNKVVKDLVTGEESALGRDAVFAVISLAMEAARQDTWATWVYVGRCPSEVRAALTRMLTDKIDTPRHGGKGSPWFKQGQAIMLKNAEAITANVGN